MRIYTIDWADAEAHRMIAAFASEADRDATFAKIEAIPWHEKPGYIGHDDWAEKEVRISGDLWDSHRHDGIYGHIYASSFDVLDGPIEVLDETDRTPFVRRDGK